MLTLITYPGAFDAPSLSPFCVKAMYLLNASGERWIREDTNDPRRTPMGKLPVLKTRDRLIPDSDTIRAWLEERGAEFDSGLTELERASARAFIRMAEEHMYFHLLLDRWGRDDVWPVIRDTYFRDIPRPLRGLITGGLRRGVLRGMAQQGLGRMTPEMRLARLEVDLRAISTRLWEGPFLFGPAPTAADASIAPMLAAMRDTPVATPLSRRIAEDTQLSDYANRVAAAWG